MVTIPFLFAEVREEVHLEGVGQFRRSAEGEVDVAGEDLGYVRARDVHAPGELGLADAQLLHAAEDAAEERRADMVDCGQGDLFNHVEQVETGRLLIDSSPLEFSRAEVYQQADRFNHYLQVINYRRVMFRHESRCRLQFNH